MRRRPLAWIFFLGIAATAVLNSAPRPAQTAASSPPAQAAEYEKRLAAVKDDIDRLRTKLGEEEKREKTVLSQLDRIGVNKRLLRSELNLLQIQLTQTRSERDSIGKSIPEIESALAADRDRLARILTTLYKNGRFNVARYVLEARDLRSFLDDIRALGIVAASQDRVIVEYAARLDELGRADENLRRKEAEIAVLSGQANAKRAESDAEERKARGLVDQIKTNQKTYEQTIEELSLRAQELQNLLKKLEALPPSQLPFPGIPFANKKGKLDWPVNGRIVQSFGLQRGSFDTKTQNNGLEIVPPAGDLTIKAVHTGKVVYADFFPSYGNLLILDHGETYYSLYGHCAEFLVPNGGIVLAGQPVAVAGDTASLVGVSLYFEIRYQTRPLDPLQWLGRR
jgi:septal ring factor EnvC (AmiA/AmiB activator)